MGSLVKYDQIIGKREMRLRFNEPVNRLSWSNNNSGTPNCDLRVFEKLYDKFSPKIFGFISQYADSKQEAEEYLVKVFLRIWNDITELDDTTENRILYIVLIVCRPIYKNKLLRKAE